MKKKQIIAYTLILIVNLLFGLKYFNRYTGHGILLSTILLIIQATGIYYFHFTKSIKPKSKLLIKYIAGILATTLILTTLFSHFYIDVHKLRIDRWSMASAVYKELFKGNYPYYAKSNIGNLAAPLPIYFLILYPFYKLGEIGIISVFGYLILIKKILKPNKQANTQLILTLLLGSFLFAFWEITTRSNIFSNSVLIILTMEYFDSIKKNTYNTTFFLSAILTGLALSTRTIFIVIYSITFISSLINKEIKLSSLLLYGVISASTFFLTFLPLLAYFWDDFWITNPFIVQSSIMMPKIYAIVFALSGIVFSVFLKNKVERNLYGGILLFLITLVFYLFNSTNLSLKQALLVEGADISYFIFSVPFLMLYILQSGSSNKNQHQTALPTD